MVSGNRRHKREVRQQAQQQGIPYTRALRESASPPVHSDDVARAADAVIHRWWTLNAAPHAAVHAGQCVNRDLFEVAISAAFASAAKVSGSAGTGVVDEMTCYHAEQVHGQLTRAWALTRDELAVLAQEVRTAGQELRTAAQAAMVASCELVTQLRPAPHPWESHVTMMSSSCSPGTRTLRLRVRRGGLWAELPPGCVQHVAEESVSWSQITEVEIVGAEAARAHRVAQGLRETEHFLLGARWWEHSGLIAPTSPLWLTT